MIKRIRVFFDYFLPKVEFFWIWGFETRGFFLTGKDQIAASGAV